MQNAMVAACRRMGVTKYANPRALRVAIADAFLANVEKYHHALPDGFRTRNGPARYAKGIRDGNQWSDELELVLAQKLVKRPVHIYSYLQHTVTRIGGAEDDAITIPEV